MSCCILETGRLILRPPELSDLPHMVPLVSDFEVSKNLGRVAHPYTQEHAREFYARAEAQRASGTDFNFAITRKDDRAYLGGCGLHLKDGTFEMGYWLGKPYWGMGYATEAAKKLAGFAFHDLKATRLVAAWFHDNPASGRVLAKLGYEHYGSEPRDCLARGHQVYCHNVELRREKFGRVAA
jgi:[ribosomal protein S5]-alanine N-acetyltransferase